MTMISIIAAVDEQWGLGKDNQLLCHLPADLKHFKRLTLGKSILMGRKTFESIGKPLPQRRNIVLSHQYLENTDVECVDSLTSALDLVKEEPELMVIGGATIFQQVLSITDQIYLTVIHHQFIADVFFPSLSKVEWSCIDSTFYPNDEKNPYDMTFYHFKKKSAKLGYKEIDKEK